ncbi:MAG: hypothetical protein WBQ26_10620 [Gemmatimonadaceae bacterium]|nr:hypothetical protein [Gemmatimonadaceae bacterium]
MPDTHAPTVGAPSSTPRGFPKAFAAVALVIYTVDFLVARSPAAPRHGIILGIPLGVTLDLTLVVSALYWLLVIRPAGASAARVIAAFMLSLLGARLVLRPDQREYLLYARFLVAPFELALIAYVVVKVRRATHGFRGTAPDADVPERIVAALSSAFPYRVVGQILATELTIGFYALCSWRRRPHAPAGSQGFSFHRKTGLLALYWAVIGVCVVELFVVHLVVRAFSPRTAWILSAFSALGVIWLVGFVRAMVLRPVLVTASGIVVRSGVQWTLDVPFSAIQRLDAGRVTAPVRHAPACLRVGGAAPPSVRIDLGEPLVAAGAYGRTKRVKTITLTLDDAPAFAKAVHARRGAEA